MIMSLQRTHYEVLGVPSAATTDEIKRQYRVLAHKFHPDKVEDKALGQKVFTQINQAYRVLSDPEKRAVYDNTLFAEKVAARSSGAASAATSGSASAASRPTPTSPPATPVPSPFAAPAPSSANVTRMLGEAETALMQNKLGNAKLICENILRADPQNLKALGLLGDTLDRMGQPQTAVAAYKRALQIAPSAMMQAKVRRLEGAAPMQAVPPAGGSGTVRTDLNRTDLNRTDQGRNDKPSGGLLGRLLGKK